MQIQFGPFRLPSPERQAARQPIYCTASKCPFFIGSVDRPIITQRRMGRAVVLPMTIKNPFFPSPLRSPFPFPSRSRSQYLHPSENGLIGRDVIPTTPPP